MLKMLIIKTQQELNLKLKIVEVNAPTGNNRVYRVSTYNLTNDEINKNQTSI